MKEEEFRKKVFLILIAVGLLLGPVALGVANGQDDGESGDGGGGVAWILCLFGTIFLVLIPFALWIFVLVWIYRDAMGRGMDTPAIWVVIAVILDVIGLIIYLIVRPKGSKHPCRSCSKWSLNSIPKCPFCGTSKEIVASKEAINSMNCRNCGAVVSRDTKICPSCYHNLASG